MGVPGLSNEGDLSREMFVTTSCSEGGGGGTNTSEGIRTDVRLGFKGRMLIAEASDSGIVGGG